jgi:serine/threonine protein kinase
LQLADFKEEDSTVCGTPNYISPETLAGKRNGPYGDIWAMGCCLYTLIVGSPPFDSPSRTETIMRIKDNKFTIP